MLMVYITRKLIFLKTEWFVFEDLRHAYWGTTASNVKTILKCHAIPPGPQRQVIRTWLPTAYRGWDDVGLNLRTVGVWERWSPLLWEVGNGNSSFITVMVNMEYQLTESRITFWRQPLGITLRQFLNLANWGGKIAAVLTRLFLAGQAHSPPHPRQETHDRPWYD